MIIKLDLCMLICVVTVSRACAVALNTSNGDDNVGNDRDAKTMRAVHWNHTRCNIKTNFSCIGMSSTVPIPTPASNHVLIKVGGSSVNPCDSDTIQGISGCDVNADGTPGGDVAGTVVGLGAGCTRLTIGDKVWANRFAIGGGMAEYAVATEEQTGVMPKSISEQEAGTVPIVGGTALQCLLCLQPPNRSSPTRSSTHGVVDVVVDGVVDGVVDVVVDGVTNTGPCAATQSKSPLKNLTVVITSGSGGTGYLGIQIAKALGASKIITAATGDGPIKWMHALGADVVVDYMTHNIFDNLDNNSIDAVFDNYAAVGTADRAMPKLRTGGTFLLLPHGRGAGSLSKHPKPGVRQINFGNVDQLHYVWLDQLAAMFDDQAIMINRGSISGVQTYFKFEESARAYSTVAGGKVLGKIAVVP